jgi:hypothetical protein
VSKRLRRKDKSSKANDVLYTVYPILHDSNACHELFVQLLAATRKRGVVDKVDKMAGVCAHGHMFFYGVDILDRMREMNANAKRRQPNKRRKVTRRNEKDAKKRHQIETDIREGKIEPFEYVP